MAFVKFNKSTPESTALNTSASGYDANTVYFTRYSYVEGGLTKERRCIIMGGKKYSEYIATTGTSSSGSGAGSGSGKPGGNVGNL